MIKLMRNSPFYLIVFKLYLFLWCISMSHVEIVKVVMLPDDFLLVLNYWEKPKLSLE